MSVSMDALTEKSGRHKSRGEVELFDLNLAPIIDCFTVLITYLLMSASFISLGIMDADIAASTNGAAAQAETNPNISVTVEIIGVHGLKLVVTGAEHASISIKPTSAGEWNFDELGRHIQGLKSKWANFDNVTVTAEDRIPYKDVVPVVEKLKKMVNKVALSDS